MPEVCHVCGLPVVAGTCANSGCSAARRAYDVRTEPPAPPDVFGRDTVVPAAGSTPGGGPPPATGTDPEDVRIPGYEIARVLGRGGMGVVFEGRQLSLSRKTAVKILPRHLAAQPDMAARFEREAAAMARLTHPNIVAVYDRGQADGLPYFSMEYVEPGPDGPADLRQAIDRRLLGEPLIRRLAVQVARALDYAHHQGVVHRDVKPANVMIDRHGSAKVTDFGIAAVANGDDRRHQLTMAGSAMGTFGYMAPEQRRDAGASDARADVFSLGVMVYEMLTGDLPVGAYSPPSRAVPGLSPEWDEVVARATASRPEDRYPTMADFAAALEAVGTSTLGPDHTASDAARSTPNGAASHPCPGCGVLVAPNDRFCGGCGFALVTECPSCETPARTGVRFCPKCRFDLEGHRRREGLREQARRLLADAADPERPRDVRAEAAARAVLDLRDAAEIPPPDPAVRGAAEAAARVAVELFLEAAEASLKEREYGPAAAQFRRVLEVEAGHAKAARRLAEIERKRAERLSEARNLLSAGQTREGVRLLSALARAFPGDPEIEADLRRARDGEAFAAEARDQSARLQAERRYVELVAVFHKVREAGGVPDWLDRADAEARGRIHSADARVLTAKDAMAVGNHGRARDKATAALAIVSDHPGAIEVLREATTRIERVTGERSEISKSLASGRWFRVLDRLRLLTHEGVPARDLQAELGAAAAGAARARGGLRVAALAVLGAAWLLASPAGAAALAALLGFAAAREAYAQAVVANALIGLSGLTLLATVAERGSRGITATRWVIGSSLVVPPAVVLWLVPNPVGTAGGWAAPSGDWKFVVGEVTMIAAAAAAVGGALGCCAADAVGRSIPRPSALPTGTVEAGALYAAAGATVGVLSAGEPSGLLSSIPLAWAVAGLLAGLGLARTGRRYVLMSAAAAAAGGLGLVALPATVSDVLTLVLFASAAAASVRPFGMSRGAAAAGLAGLAWFVFPSFSAPALAALIWCVAVGEVAVRAADQLDFRPHLLDRARYLLARGPRIEVPTAVSATGPRRVEPNTDLAAAWGFLPMSATLAVGGAVSAGWLPVGLGVKVASAAAAVALPAAVVAFAGGVRERGRLVLSTGAAALGFIVLLAGIGLWGTNPTEPPPGWEPFAPTGQAFAAMLPRNRWPDAYRQEVPSGSLLLRGWRARDEGGRLTVGIFSDAFDTVPVGGVADIAESEAKRAGSPRPSVRATWAGWHRGIEAEDARPDGPTTLTRMYLHAGRLYVITAVLDPARTEEDVAKAGRFLRTFRLTPVRNDTNAVRP